MKSILMPTLLRSRWKDILTVEMLGRVFGVKADIFVNSQGISVLSPVSLVERD